MTDLQIEREWTQVLVSAVCADCGGRGHDELLVKGRPMRGMICAACRGAGRVLRFEWRRRAELEALRKGGQG